MNAIQKIIIKILFDVIGVLRHRTGRDSDFSLKMERFSAVEDMGFSSLETIVVESDEKIEKIIQLAYKYTLPRQNLILDISEKTRLQPIFSNISLVDSTNLGLVYPLNELNPEILPLEINLIKEEEHYEGLYKKILKSADKITDVDFSDFNNTILAFVSLLEKYTFTVPFSDEYSYISLFDYTLSSIAIATAIYRYHEEIQDFSNLESIEEKFCVIQGYFYGIQSFILTNGQKSDKYASKILRARSFFLSISSEIIAHRICNLFQIPPTSIVMNAGGKFTILAPNIKNSKEKIDDLANRVNKEFVKLNYGQTKFIFAHNSFSNSEFINEKFHNVFKTLCQKFEHQKKVTPSNQKETEEQVNKINRDKLCDICNQHPGEQDSNYEDLIICSVCRYMKNLGTKIAQEDSVSIFEGQKVALEDSIFYKEKKYQIKFDISYNKPFSGNVQKRLVNYIPHYTNSPIDNKKFSLYEQLNNKETDNRIPGTPMMFEYIAASSLEADKDNGKLIGRTFLGVLEADIDNLSQLFTDGFGDSSFFPNLLNLSRTIDYFFTGWLNKQLQNKFKNIYAIFAGGDDLLLLGNYLEIYELAYELIRHFNFYTGSHREIHLSLGIYLSNNTTSVSQITQQVKQELKKSKSFESGKPNSKNATTVLGISMNNDTYLKLYPRWQDFDSLMEDKVSTYFLLKLLTFIKMNKKTEKQKTDWKKLYHKHTKRYFENYKEHIILSKLPFEIEEHGNGLILPISIALYKNLKL